MTSPAYMVVEDGSGYTNSNAYWDVDSVVTYLNNSGSTDFANYTNDEQARAIIRATMFIEKRFKRKYRGIRQTVEQALGWPRIGAFDDDNFTIFGIPFQIQYATAEYAARAARYGVLAPDPLRVVPSQDLSAPPAGVTYATGVYTGTANFNVGDTITIGTRVYTFVSTTPSLDGQVLVGGTLAASLLNLYAAINNSPDIATGLFTATQNFVNGDTIFIGNRTYVFVNALSPENVTDILTQVAIGGTLAQSLANIAAAINYVGEIGVQYYALNRDKNVTATSTATTLLLSANTNMNISNFETVTPTSVATSSNTQAGSFAYGTLVLSGGSGTNYFVLAADPSVSATVTPTQLNVTSPSSTANGLSTKYTPNGASAGGWGSTALAGGLVTSVTPTLIMGPTREIVQKVGPLEITQTFDGLAQRAIQDERTTRAAQSAVVNDYNIPEYPEADMWLEQIIRNSASGIRLVRA